MISHHEARTRGLGPFRGIAIVAAFYLAVLALFAALWLVFGAS